MTKQILTSLFTLIASSGIVFAADTPMTSPTPTPQMVQPDDGSKLYLEIPESVLQSMRERYDSRHPKAYPTPVLIANGGGDPTPSPTSSGSSGSSSGGGSLKECGNAGAGPTGFAVTTMNNMPNPSDPSETWTLGTGHSTVRNGPLKLDSGLSGSPELK